MNLKPQTFDDFFKILAVVGAIGSFIFGVYRWEVESKNDFKKPFYTKQLDYYTAAVEATATLATEDYNSEDYQTAKKTFQRLYWGQMSIVENKAVERQMVIFLHLLDKYESDCVDSALNAAPAKKDSAMQFEKSVLQTASLNLAHLAFVHTTKNFIGSEESSQYNRDLDTSYNNHLYRKMLADD